MSNLNTNVTGDSGMSAEMRAYYDRNLIENAKPNLVHAQFGQKRVVPKNSGRTVEFRRYDNLPKALTPLTEGVTPDGKKLNVTTVSATLSQYGDYVAISDMLELTALDRNIVEAQDILGDQAGRTLDTITREVLNSGTNVQYAGGKLSRGTLTAEDILTEQDVKKAVTTLENGLASKISGSYVAIIHPNVAHDLMSNTLWEDVKKYDPKDLYEGELGRLYGVRFVESTEAKVFGADPLCGEHRTLSVGTALSAPGRTLTLKEQLTEQEAAELAGKTFYLAGKRYTIASATSGQSSTLTVSDTDDPIPTADAPKDAVLYEGSGASDGGLVYSTLFLGQNAYGDVELSGGGLESIVKQRGSGGTADPLNQRSTVGWKAAKAAVILTDAFMVRVESRSSMDEEA